MRLALATLAFPLFAQASAVGGDGDGKATSRTVDNADRKPETSSPAILDADREAGAFAFVRQHHPELATVLETLKPMNPPEYRKAIGELSQVSRTLAALQSRNPGRYELVLENWKAKSRVELLTAQLVGAPSEEIRSQLRLAIEARLDVEIHRQRFELDQAEIAAKKARENLNRLEKNRDSLVESRFRALQPKKSPFESQEVSTRQTRRHSSQRGGPLTSRRFSLMVAFVWASTITPLALADVPIRPASLRFADEGVKEVPDFQRHILTLMGRLGCNTRSCHCSF